MLTLEQKIREAIIDRCSTFGTITAFQATELVKAALSAIKDDEPAEPKRDWLKVDENTPHDALCWAGPRSSTLAEKSRFPSPEVCELFIGIHLLDNPGLDSPPCSGDILVILADGEPVLITDRNTHNYKWQSVVKGIPIVQWAPIKWVEGRLVVDIDRLRHEQA